MIFPNWCVLCESEEEAVDHMFIHCNFSNWIWDEIALLMNIQWAKPKILAELVEQWDPRSGRKKLMEAWNLLALHMCWAIWKERNASIFKRSSGTVAKTLELGINALTCLLMDPTKNLEIMDMMSRLHLETPLDTTSGEGRSSMDMSWWLIWL